LVSIRRRQCAGGPGDRASDVAGGDTEVVQFVRSEYRDHGSRVLDFEIDRHIGAGEHTRRRGGKLGIHPSRQLIVRDDGKMV